MRKPDSDNPRRASAYDRALGLLARREHSRRELARKLEAKGYAGDESVPALDALEQRREQSDERFAEALIRRRADAGYGPRYIEAELQSHGIAPAPWRDQLAAIDWLAIARGSVAKRRGSDRDRDAQYLARRGFPSDVVARALRGMRD